MGYGGRWGRAELVDGILVVQVTEIVSLGIGLFEGFCYY